MQDDDVAVVTTLKRKVQSLDTNLLEWRRCTCTFTRDHALVLELSDDDVDDVVLFDANGHNDQNTHTSVNGSSDDDGGAQRQLQGKCRVVIALGTQLRRIEQKRKCKTRCTLEFVVAGPTPADANVVTSEELMASSAKLCQQFVDQVCESERQARRKLSIRLGAALAANTAAATAAAVTTTATAAITIVPSPLPSQAERSASVSMNSSSTTVAAQRELRIATPGQQLDHVDALDASSAKSSSSSASDGGSGNSHVVLGALSTSNVVSSTKSDAINPARTTTRAAAAAAAPLMELHVDVHAAASTNSCWTRAHSPRVPADYESDTLDSSSGVVSPLRDVRGAAVTPIEVAVEAAREAHSVVQSTAPSKALARTSERSNESDVSSRRVRSSSSLPVPLVTTKPLSHEVFAERLASLRRSSGDRRAHSDSNNIVDDHSVDNDDDDDCHGSHSYSRRHSRVLAPPRRLARLQAPRHALGVRSKRRSSSSHRLTQSAGSSSVPARGRSHHRYEAYDDNYEPQRSTAGVVLLRRRQHSSRSRSSSRSSRSSSSSSNSRRSATATAARLASKLHRLQLHEQHNDYTQQRNSNHHGAKASHHRHHHPHARTNSSARRSVRILNNNNNNSNNDDDDDDDASTIHDSSHCAELHILARVEAALRHLERENARGLDRERALAHDAQTLQDALRVQCAETQHVETQRLALARESDAWQQVARQAEQTATQLGTALSIARDEAQLLQREARRLALQNKELLAHVHRLDALVYGRFGA